MGIWEHEGNVENTSRRRRRVFSTFLAIHGLPVKSGKSDWLRIWNEYSAHAQKFGSGKLVRQRTLCCPAELSIPAAGQNDRGLWGRECTRTNWTPPTPAPLSPRVYLRKFNTGRLRPGVQPLTLLHAILADKVPLLYTFYYKKVPLSHTCL